MSVDKAPFTIQSAEQLVELWSRTYNDSGKPDWSHLLPYYAEEIHFTDTVQELRGIDAFREMVERLSRRSSELRMHVLHAAMAGQTVFIEWEMTILFRKTRTSVMHGVSRITLNDHGKITEQRDYYDLWGTILGNIPGVGWLYHKFMRSVFG
ncbi:MAG: hypothetical protein Kow0077_15600 [Anaerolineae bacterium]